MGLILGSDRLALFETVSHRKEIRLTRLAVARIGGAASAKSLVFESGDTGATDVEGIEFFRAARELLSQVGKEPRRVIASLPEGSVTQQVLSLPRMGRKTLRQVLLNKVRAGAGALKDPDAILWNWVSLGVVEENGTEREDVLLVSIPRATLLQYYSVLRRAGIQVESFTTPQFATLSIVLGSGATSAEDAAVLSVGAKAASFTILRGGRIQFSREMPLAPGADPAAGSDRLVHEVHRSLLFFQQKFPDRSVERLRIVHDDVVKAATLGKAFREKLELEVEVVDPLGLVTGDAEILARARSEVAGLTTLAGLALYPHLRKDQRLGLMPREVKEKKLNFTVDAIMVATIAIAGAVAVFCDQAIDKSLELKRGLARTREEEIASLSGYDAQVAAIEDRIRRIGLREAEKERVLERSIDWSGLGLSLSRAVPDSIRLREFTVAPDPNAGSPAGPFHLRIEGETLKDPAAAGTDLLRLKDSLSRAPAVRDVEVRLLAATGGGDDAPPASKDPEALKWSRFEADAEVRLPAETIAPAPGGAKRAPGEKR